jgi:predicted MFS family arabinose efflux permease
MFKRIMPLSAILSLRFLGLFLVLPVLSAYAMEMPDATAMLVGIIVGGYALTQALFQLPFGVVSDKIGRKLTLFIGLLIFLAGSVICAVSDSIYMLMLGRFLQGAGAIGAVITAMISDLVPEEVRAKAMAMMGGSIALSFAVAMGLGPVLGASYGVETLFWITAALSVLAMVLLFTKVPTPPRIHHIYNDAAKTSDILKDATLLRLIITGGLQKGLMTVAFVIIPLILTASAADNGFGWEKSDLWKVYLPAMVIGLLAMGPSAVFGEKHNKPKQIFLLSILFFGLSFLLMGYAVNSALFIAGVVSFFIGFNMMEPLLQSMISKFAKVHQKGAALGIANSVAYFGTFIGGTAAGLVLDISDRQALGMLLGIIALAWLLWTLKMPNPVRHSHLYVPVGEVDQEKLKAGLFDEITEWYINQTENILVIKFKSEAVDHEALKEKVKKG